MSRSTGRADIEANVSVPNAVDEERFVSIDEHPESGDLRSCSFIYLFILPGVAICLPESPDPFEVEPGSATSQLSGCGWEYDETDPFEDVSGEMEQLENSQCSTVDRSWIEDVDAAHTVITSLTDRSNPSNVRSNGAQYLEFNRRFLPPATRALSIPVKVLLNLCIVYDTNLLYGLIR